MKKVNILFIILLFSINFTIAQHSFTVTTQYVSTPNGDYKKENITFSYDKVTKMLTMTNNDIQHSDSFPVILFNSAYSEDDNFFIEAFAQDTSKLDSIAPSNVLTGFIIFFDEKLGRITHIHVRRMKTKPNDFFSSYHYTEYGIKYREEKYGAE